jgi:uncharacterized protein YjiS (DUF1127 family)
MSTTHSRRESAQTAVWILGVSSFFKKYWRVLQEWLERQKSRAALDHLSDKELIDIGIARGEIDYVACSRHIDQRGRSAEWIRYLPTVDGQIWFPTDARLD